MGEAGGGGGTMDRFLASVERTNAETEARLGEDTDPDTSSGAQQPRPGSGGVNLRRGRTISSRWHSMESLYCTVLYCTVLYCTVLYCTLLYCTILYCTVLYCTDTDLMEAMLRSRYCSLLYCTVLYCTVLYCTVQH